MDKTGCGMARYKREPASNQPQPMAADNSAIQASQHSLSHTATQQNTATQNTEHSKTEKTQRLTTCSAPHRRVRQAQYM